MVSARLAGQGAAVAGGRREVRLEGLLGATRVDEALRRVAAALGVEAGAEVALRSESRLLQAMETLAEAGVRAGGVVEVCVRERGGMPGTGSESPSVLTPDPVHVPVTPRGVAGGSDEELLRTVEGLLGELSRDESGISGAMQRLHEVQQVLLRSCESDLREELARLDAVRRQHAEAEAVLLAEVEPLRAPAAAQTAGAGGEVLAGGVFQVSSPCRVCILPVRQSSPSNRDTVYIKV
jgi:hypothetical protein